MVARAGARRCRRGIYHCRRRHKTQVTNKKMTEKELLSLKKSELLEIMLAQSREIDSLRAQLEEAKAELADKRINIEQSGSIAEASLKLTRIFEEAQKAADLYLENVKKGAHLNE